MATCTLKLYKTKLTPERNALVDNLSDYLSSLPSTDKTYTSNNFQYIKIALDLVIKINVNQSSVGDGSLGNYADIYQDNKHYYYFITEARWKALDTVELYLSIDSINTFSGDFQFSDKTNIIRQHKSRYMSTDRVNFESTTTLHRVVDPINEGINGTVKVKYGNDHVFKDSGHANQNWYLVYRTVIDEEAEDNKPLEVVLLPKTHVPLSDGYVSTMSLNKSIIGTSNYWIFTAPDNPSFSLVANGNTYDFSDNDVYTYALIGRADPASTTELYQFKNSSGGWTIKEYANTITLNNSDGYRLSSTLYHNTVILFERTSLTDLKVGHQGIKYSSQISNIDRSSSNIVSIIELPYLPCEIGWSANTIILPTGWSINSANEIQLNDYTSEFEYNLINNFGMSDMSLYINFDNRDDMITDIYRNNRESKLLHSDFYDYKLNYDTFNSSIAMERLGQESADKKINLFFKPSNSLNSELAFKWTLANNVSYKENQDYEHFLLSSRNNSIGLYNSDFLNYVKTGYNYDQKAKTRTIAASWTSTGISIVGSIIGAVVTKGASTAISAVAIASTATNAVSNISKSIETTINQQEALKQKLDQYKQQSASVSEANSVDLLNWYNGNKLILMKYRVTDDIQTLLTKLFHYCGYAVGKQGVPETNTRTWFNFIQCEPVFTNESIYNNFIDDIKARYNAGVTVYHKVALHAGEETETYTWDWEQQYENWETFLFS